MKLAKRISLMGLALLLLLLPGCQRDEEQEYSEESSVVSEVSEVEEEIQDGPYSIGLIQYDAHPAHDTLREAFYSRLADWGYDDENAVTIDYQNANGDDAAAQTICQAFVNAEVDLIIAISLSAAQQAVSSVEGTDIKVLFSAVKDPAVDLGMTDLNAPTGNMTGVITPASHIASAALAMQTDISSMGLLYNPDEAEASTMAALVRTYCEGHGLTVQEQTVTDSESAAAAMEALSAEVDAVFIPTDFTVSAAMTAVTVAAQNANTPIYTCESVWVKNGALAAVGFDYAKAGQQTADMAVSLIGGREISSLPTVTVSADQTYVNHDVLETLGLTFSEDTMRKANFFVERSSEAESGDEVEGEAPAEDGEA